MLHDPLLLKEVGLSFPKKTCFSGVSTSIYYGQKIALIGRNGCGKTTLLKMIQGLIEPSEGSIMIPQNVTFGYVPQLIEEFESLSGGQRVNKALTRALAVDPSILCLDEPTNNLDARNKNALMLLLCRYHGTLLVITHDVALLRRCVDHIWHIDEGQIRMFSGNYDDYRRESRMKRASIEQDLSRLERQKKEMHQALMKEQTRASKSRIKGEKSIDKRKWPTIVSKAKAVRAEETTGNKKAALDHKKQVLSDKLSELRLPDVIVPKFLLNSTDLGDRTLVSISEGSVGYHGCDALFPPISFSVGSHDHVAISCDNGSGKSTLIKAILDDPAVIKSGVWHIPKSIGYLDQHYGTLDPEKTVLETIQEETPDWTFAEVRRHLNDFLFRKNEDVFAGVRTLSGGEKVRLSLAQIAARTPSLLILDEITNNIDIETRDHIIQVLKAYPGAILIVSHDEDFLEQIRIDTVVHLP